MTMIKTAPYISQVSPYVSGPGVFPKMLEQRQPFIPQSAPFIDLPEQDFLQKYVQEQLK